MNIVKDLQIVPEGVRRLTRREAARRLLGCMASGTLAWASGGHPFWKHLSNDELLGKFEADPTAGKLRFLSQVQFESLARLSEAIVPGARKAQAAEFIDLLLSAEAAKEQKEFGDSMSVFETESTKRYGKKLAAIGPAELNQLLTDATTQPKTDSKTQSLRNAFENLKEWISGAYYSSEMGMRELGWTPDRVFSEFPGCTHAEHS
jgi:hypothetical protein